MNVCNNMKEGHKIFTQNSNASYKIPENEPHALSHLG